VIYSGGADPGAFLAGQYLHGRLETRWPP
jgi:hypothetical protein